LHLRIGGTDKIEDPRPRQFENALAPLLPRVMPFSGDCVFGLDLGDLGGNRLCRVSW
jgi:hypothetical protein